MKNENYINELVGVYQKLAADAEIAEQQMSAEGLGGYSCGIQAGIAIAYRVAATRLENALDHQRQMDSIKEAFAL
jgi:hypothetical protein